MPTLHHLEHFANTIGPRGSCTPAEKKAHDYCQDTLAALGYNVHRDEFLSVTSGWRPYALALVLMLLAVLLFVVFDLGPGGQLGLGPDAQMGALAAAALGLIVAASFFLNASHRPNPLLWVMPLEASQNVWASAEPRADVRRRVVVTGHVDTARHALAMQSPGLWQVFQVLTTLTGLALVVLVALFIWGIFTPDPLPRTIAAGLAVLLLVDLVFTVQPDTTPFVVGANDNATGAAAVLGLAERLKSEPLEHTQVFLVNTGCEEVGCTGLVDWIERHAVRDAPQASYLVLDNIGGRGSQVNYLLDETVLLPIKADPGLVAHAEQVARAHPELGAQPFHYRGLFSEMSIAAARGQAALGLLDFDPRTRMPPNFHTARDTMANIDPEVLAKSEAFAWALLQKLDAA
jgi:hypothetical protein